MCWFLHLMYLVGFRNRLLVLINWAWDYVFYNRAVRLIMNETHDSPPVRPGKNKKPGIRQPGHIPLSETGVI